MGGESNGRLTASAVIRETALEEFAQSLGDTSIVRVAKAAGVPIALVEEHFATDTELREAVDEYVVSLAVEAFADFELSGSSDDAMEELGRRITNLIMAHPNALLYVARSVIEGDPGGLAMFDAFMAIATQQFQALAEEDRLDPDLDIQWAALHVVIFNLATLLFKDAIENHLPESFMTPEGMERWHVADAELFRRGFLRRAEPELSNRN